MQKMHPAKFPAILELHRAQLRPQPRDDRSIGSAILAFLSDSVLDAAYGDAEG
jgi:hypothetical protein